jgi:hypothetical protein
VRWTCPARSTSPRGSSGRVALHLDHGKGGGGGPPRLLNTATGTFLFIWAKISNVFAKRQDFTYKLEAAGKSKVTSVSVVLVRPASEAEFYEMSHLFVMTINPSSRWA